jgi:5-formyltetrahydrofolate cyclo-ligase
MNLTKAEWRAKLRLVVRNFPVEKRLSDSQRLCQNLKSQVSFQKARSILFFASLTDEPDLWPLIGEALARKKLVALPCFDFDNQIYQPRRITDVHVEILSGKFGIREPINTCVAVPLDDLDAVLVPGVAFGVDGHRLGRGKGFYDRLLENFKGTKIGIAFDEQIVDSIPAEENDVRMDFVITPTRILGNFKQLNG